MELANPLVLQRLLFGAFALADILDYRDETHRRGRGGIDAADMQADPDDAAIRCQIALFHHVAGQLAGSHRLGLGDIEQQILRMGDRLEIAAQQLRFAAAENLAEAAVDGQPVALGIQHRDADCRLLEDRAQFAAVLVEPQIVGQEFGDIEPGGEKNSGLPSAPASE